jgi:hypothetical protein
MMATVTTCPKCAEKLRLPDEYLGKKVRCARCSTVFEAADCSAEAPPAGRPAAGMDIHLDLSLDDPDEQARPKAPGGASRSRPVGAVEVDMTPRSPAGSPAAAPESPPDAAPSEPSEKKQPRDRDDRTRCPVCRRFNEQAARRCYHCGERFRSGRRTSYPDSDEDDYDDDHGFRRRRRDTEPHRGGVVLAMGIVSLVGLVVIPVLPVIFGIIGWVMGQIDLRKMRNNQMDRDGEGTTRAGWICSIIGTLLNAAFAVLCCGFYGFIIMAATNAAPRTTRTWTAPPAPAKVMQPKDWNAQPNNDKAFKDFEEK